VVESCVHAPGPRGTTNGRPRSRPSQIEYHVLETPVRRRGSWPNPRPIEGGASRRTHTARAEVYYFSGTGNSLVLAKLVAERLGGELIPVASVVDRERIEPVADVIGIVFPVYYADTSNIVRGFAEKLRSRRGSTSSRSRTTEEAPATR
jgi:hypothetical protein